MDNLEIIDGTVGAGDTMPAGTTKVNGNFSKLKSAVDVVENSVEVLTENVFNTNVNLQALSEIQNTDNAVTLLENFTNSGGDTDYRIHIPMPAPIKKLSFDFHDRRSHLVNIRTINLSFTGQELLYNKTGWNASSENIWRQLNKTFNLEDGSYVCRIYSALTAQGLMLSLQDTHSSRNNSFGAIRNIVVEYEPLVNIQIETPAKIPYIAAWSSWGGSAWQAPDISITPDRDITVKCTWYASGYRAADGAIGWDVRISGGTLLSGLLRTLGFSHSNTHAQLIPAVAFIKINKGDTFTPVFGTPLNNTISDHNDRYQIIVEEI